MPHRLLRPSAREQISACARSARLRRATAESSRCCPAAAAASCGAICRCSRPRIARSQQRRPRLRGMFGGGRRAPQRGRSLERSQRDALTNVEIVDGVSRALAQADGAWVASGTAVLGDGALRRAGRRAVRDSADAHPVRPHRMIRHRFITLPNLVLGREVVPELLQEAATPERLADALEALMSDPATQYAALRRAAARRSDRPTRWSECARYAVELAASPRRCARDPHLSHVGSARPPRHRAAPARAARRAAGPALRLRRLAARKPERLSSQRADRRRAGRGRLRRASDRQSRVSLSLRLAARARVAHAPSAGLHEPARYAGARSCRSRRRCVSTSPTTRRRRYGCTCSGLLVMQYPVGSVWERVFGWRFLDPWQAVEPYARRVARGRSARRALAPRPVAAIASWRGACRAST